MWLHASVCFKYPVGFPTFADRSFLSGNEQTGSEHITLFNANEHSMKNIAHKKDLENILERIRRLTPESNRKWGKMNVNQMICHLCDPLRCALHERSFTDISNPLYRTIGKWVFLYLFPFPKHAPTGVEFNQLKGSGTPVTGFEADRTSLIRLLNQLHNSKSGEGLAAHPLFGDLSYWEWGRITWLHLDHHLKQFGE